MDTKLASSLNQLVMQHTYFYSTSRHEAACTAFGVFLSEGSDINAQVMNIVPMDISLSKLLVYTQDYIRATWLLIKEVIQYEVKEECYFGRMVMNIYKVECSNNIISDNGYSTILFVCSLRLGVRGQRHYGALTMSPGMNLRSSRLYVGGVPPGITLNQLDLPVLHGIVGGIRNIKVNTK